MRDSMGPEIPDVRGRTLGGPDNLTPLTPSSKTAEASWGSSTLSAEAACKFRSGSTGIQHPQPSETGGKRGRDDSFDSQQGSGDFVSTALQQGMSHGGASETALPRKGRCGVKTSAAGEVAAVQSAVDSGAKLIADKGLLVNKVVIPQPRPELLSEMI